MPKESHKTAAKNLEHAPTANNTAAQNNQKNDPKAAEHSEKAHGHSEQAHKHSTEAHGKSKSKSKQGA
jgi:hypothetical protein